MAATNPIVYPFHKDFGPPEDSFLERFGKYGKTLYNPRGGHLAWDSTGVPAGTPIYSPVSGTVVKVGYDAGYLGHHVVIRNKMGDFWLNHMQRKPDVVKGQGVKRYYSRIGLVGSTGHAFGAHLDIKWFLGDSVGKAWGTLPAGNVYPFISYDYNSRY